MTEQPIPRGGMFICRPKPIIFSTGFEQDFELMSDTHIGARNVDYELIQDTISDGVKRKARFLINGDVFDMILVQDRKRFRADCIHPRLAGKSDLIDQAVNWGVEIFKPAADLIDMVGVGNHEEAIVKYHSKDVIKQFVAELKRHRRRIDHTIHYGGYTGFVDYRFRWGTKYKGQTSADSKRFVIYYHHGSGGGAPVTKGMIDFSRKGWVDSDVIWHGHKHHQLAAKIQRVGCPVNGYEPTVKDVRHIQTGSYFDTYQGQTQQSLEEDGRITNYAADWGVAPAGKGGATLRLSFGYNRSHTVKVIQ